MGQVCSRHWFSCPCSCGIPLALTTGPEEDAQTDGQAVHQGQVEVQGQGGRLDRLREADGGGEGVHGRGQHLE